MSFRKITQLPALPGTLTLVGAASAVWTDVA